MNIASGITVAVIAGSMNGLFPLPMKANKSWAWENTWLPFSLLSFGVFPWLIAWYTVPHLAATYSHAGRESLIAALCCGILVYTGSLLFGISIIHIGVALSFALLIGTMTAVGVLVPPLLLHHSLLSSTGGVLILGGVTLSVLSVALGVLASKGKEGQTVDSAPSASGSLKGSLLAVVGGALSGFLPAGMVMPWAYHLVYSAVSFGGASLSQATNAVLALVLVGGAIPNCGYSAYLLWTNRTHIQYQQHNHFRYWLMVLSMAMLYSVSVALWGIAISSPFLGPLGPSVGWALFVGMIVVASTVTGLISGEWKHARRFSIGQLAASVIALIGAMVLICFGTYLG